MYSSSLLRIAFAFVIAFASTLLGSDFTLSRNQIEIVTLPMVDHQPARVTIAYSSTPRVAVRVASDVDWAKPVIDEATGDLIINFSTKSLVGRSKTATISVTAGGTSAQVFVRAEAMSPNLSKVVDDPSRNRVYAIQVNDQLVQGRGALVAFDPISEEYTGLLTIGNLPGEMSISSDGTEAVVLCSASPSLVVVDLEAFQVKETIALPQFVTDYSGRTVHVAMGKGGVVYYSDLANIPSLYVFNRSAQTVLQKLSVSASSFGFGSFAVSPKGDRFYCWSNPGWYYGSNGSYIQSYSIAADGKLTLEQSAQYLNLPQNYGGQTEIPVIVSEDGDRVLTSLYAYDAASLSSVIQRFPKSTDSYDASCISAASPGGEIVSTSYGVYDGNTAALLSPLPVKVRYHAITSDYTRLVYVDPSTKNLKSFDLTEILKAGPYGRLTSPEKGAVILAPPTFTWQPTEGVDKYNFYLGTEKAAVEDAGVDAPQFLGEVIGSSYKANTVFSPGTTYYWRVDPVGNEEGVKGDVLSFTVSPIAATLSSPSGPAVQGNPRLTMSLSLTSETAGQPWKIGAMSDWINVSESTGVTPAVVEVSIDTTTLAAGANSGKISIETSDGTADLPVRFSLAPLVMTKLVSDPDSSLVYGISEDPVTLQCYLLEIDSSTEKVLRVVNAGQSVTDLTVHSADSRLYFTNWSLGLLNALDKATLTQVRQYKYSTGSTSEAWASDVYNVAAGSKGRILVRGSSNWTNVHLIDTDTGRILSSRAVFGTNPKFSPDSRYFYVGDANYSSTPLSKFDTTGDVISLKSSLSSPYERYYYSNELVVTDDGNRIFWNGGVFSADLAEEWSTKDYVYSASATGRWAFGESKVFDLDKRTVVLSMPANTKVSAFNTASEKLVVQVGTEIQFFAISENITHPAPVLSMKSVEGVRITVQWTDRSMETGFTLQYRESGTAAWADREPAIAANVTSAEFGGLKEATAYEFRVKADSPGSSSSWSNVLSVKTGITPPLPPYAWSYGSGPRKTSLLAYLDIVFDSLVIEKLQPDGKTWKVLATRSNLENLTVEDTGLEPETTYFYRMKVTKGGLSSPYTSPIQISTTPLPPLPIIYKQPLSTTIPEGQDGYIYVDAGYADSVRWYKDDVELQGVGSYIVFRRADASIEGRYYAVASNETGSTRTETVTLKVGPSIYAGVYSSPLPDGSGRWALVIRNSTSGVFAAYLNSPKAVAYFPVTVYPDGSFFGADVLLQNNTVSSSETKADLKSIAMSGRIYGGVLNGYVNDLGVVASRSSTFGPTASLSGLYSSAGLGGATGSLVTVINGDGTALSLILKPGAYSGGFGACDIAGNLTINFTDGSVVSGTVDSGLGSVAAKRTSGSAQESFATLLAASKRTDRLMNISSRGVSGDGDNVMIAGFVVSGDKPRTLLVRGAGPSLAKVNVPDPEANPSMAIFSEKGEIFASNDDWEKVSNLGDLKQAAASVGAFEFYEKGKDSALLVTLNPGRYTVITSAQSQKKGVLLTEVYDVSALNDITPAVVNMSIRGHVGTADELVIAGFVIGGNSPKRVLVRAAGPGLGKLMDPKLVIPDPVLTLVRSGTTVVENDNWDSSSSEMKKVMAEVGAFPFDDGSKDAAVLVTLEPGVYTGLIRGAKDATGIALIEIYQVP